MTERVYKMSTKMKVASAILVAALTVLASNRHLRVIPLVHAADLKAADSDVLCPLGNATLSGTYSSIGGGTAVGIGPVSFVGEITYDGKGNLVNPFTVSFNGVISRLVATGTYTVNGDCTGSVSASGGHYDFVVNPDGSKVNFIETDANTVISGTIDRLRD
jgi:hypothetical protein